MADQFLTLISTTAMLGLGSDTMILELGLQAGVILQFGAF